MRRSKRGAGFVPKRIRWRCSDSILSHSHSSLTLETERDHNNNNDHDLSIDPKVLGGLIGRDSKDSEVGVGRFERRGGSRSRSRSSGRLEGDFEDLLMTCINRSG